MVPPRKPGATRLRQLPGLARICQHLTRIRREGSTLIWHLLDVLRSPKVLIWSDLKSVFPKGECGFESHPGHQEMLLNESVKGDTGHWRLSLAFAVFGDLLPVCYPRF